MILRHTSLLLLLVAAACPAPPLGDAGSLDAGADGGAPVPCWETDGEWPGETAAAVDDPAAGLGNNLSGAVWSPGDDALLVVQNGPSVLHRLVPDETTGLWAPDPAFPSRTLTYPNGAGQPDSEGVTLADPAQPFVWVASERDNDFSQLSRLSVLRYDLSGMETFAVATHEWDLTLDLGAAGVTVAPNAGLEAITFVPDALLTAAGFQSDDGALYDPSAFGEHGGGLFLVGLEGTGDVFAYALALDGNASRIASVDVGLAGVMSLELDRETGLLYVGCDDTCGNLTEILALSDGAFTRLETLQPPAALGGGNNEGIALRPAQGGERTFFWTRDGAGDGSALFTGDFPAGAVCR